jgi:hypothetical protein
VWKKGVCFDANHLKPQTAPQKLFQAAEASTT